MKRIAAGSSVFPFLQSVAVDSLEKVIAARGSTLQLNSGLRTLPQQFVLYRWYQLERCDITLAAAPGSSNHESGLAVDVQDNAGWRPFFLAEGWKWQGEVDPVHFDIQGGVDLGGLSIRAFQRLWNRNHPEDVIEDDGLYGDLTEARLTSAPIGGFPLGATCAAEPDPGQGGAAAGGTDAGGTAGNSPSAGMGGALSAPGSSGSGGAPGSPATGGGNAGGPPGSGGSALPAAADGVRDSAGCNVVAAARSSWGAWFVLAMLVVLRRRSTLAATRFRFRRSAVKARNRAGGRAAGRRCLRRADGRPGATMTIRAAEGDDRGQHDRRDSAQDERPRRRQAEVGGNRHALSTLTA